MVLPTEVRSRLQQVVEGFCPVEGLPDNNITVILFHPIVFLIFESYVRDLRIN